MGKIFCVSDTHFGAGRKNDFFETVAFHHFLEKVEREADELVLVGDIFELLQNEFLEIYIQHKVLLDHLFAVAKKVPTTLVVGNHDFLLSGFLNLEKKSSSIFGGPIKLATEWKNEKRGIFAIHGQQFDRWNRRADPSKIDGTPPIGDQIARAAGFLEKYVNPDADTFLEKMYDKYKNFLKIFQKKCDFFENHLGPADKKYRGDFSEYFAGAAKILAAKKWRLVVMGHTHHFLTKTFDGGALVNCGTWAEKSKPPTFVEIDKNTAKIIHGKTGRIFDKVLF